MFIIELLEITSTEKIFEQDVENFLITNLKLKDIKFTNKSKFLYSYIEPLLLYQVIIFEKKPPEFLYFDTKSDNEIFLYKQYAIVYKNREFYYCQKIENDTSTSEIVLFLKNSLKLDNFNVVEDIQIKKDKNYRFHKLLKTYSFRYFLIYFILLITIFYFSEFNIENKSVNLKDVINNTNNIKSEIKFSSISMLVKNLYKLAMENKVDIISIVLKNSKIALTIESNTKDTIYNFFNSIKKETLQEITFDETSKKFICNIIIQIDRR